MLTKKYSLFILSFLTIFSGFAEAQKNTKSKSSQSVSNYKNLQGIWNSNDGNENITLKFISNSKLEFDGEILNYRLSKNIIKIFEEGEEIDYKYYFEGKDLVIVFPEGDKIKFKKLNSNTKKANNSNNSNCNQVYLQAEVSGGCDITLITPRPCEEIDLSNGKVYEFAWQTGGSYCETPYKFYIAGNPVSDNNMLSWSLSEEIGKVSRKLGGIHYISANDIRQLNSNNGIYHWVVMGFYGSHPSSQTFRVKF